MLDDFERGVLRKAADHLARCAAKIADQLGTRFSCESYLTHLFAEAFDQDQLICTRETPYADVNAAAPNIGTALDLQVLTPDKGRSVLIEAKQVHDRTQDSYRARPPEHGDSIAFDISKMSKIPDRPGRTRLVMVLMTSLAGVEKPADWLNWLKSAKPLDVLWERIESGGGPLFPIAGNGWFDIYVHKL